MRNLSAEELKRDVRKSPSERIGTMADCRRYIAIIPDHYRVVADTVSSLVIPIRGWLGRLERMLRIEGLRRIEEA